MQIKSNNIDGILVLAVEVKRLDARIAVEFKENMSEFINNGHRAVVLNLNPVEFIDSSGLGALVSCLKQMGPKGRVALFGLSAPVASMFELTRMDRVFILCDTEEQALQALQA
jgi:anti-sigma B factor antagonist